MEGGGVFGDRFLGKNPYSYLLQQPPPLFPLPSIYTTNSNSIHLLQTPIPTWKKKGERWVSPYGFGDVPYGATQGHGSGFYLPSLQEMRFADEAGPINWAKERNGGLGSENFKVGSASKSGGKKPSGRRTKTSSSSSLVKGQWTAEEDRKLIGLVKKFGERKWSLISKALVGRIGKQCRERWHNHLRPDIKKDTWSEEEERLLVEAHEEIGNRWAEIAKRIPGRTENSVKNHWNATKRRQNSRRKGRKATSQRGRSQPSILQEYIRSKTIKETSVNTSPTTITKASSSTSSSTASAKGDGRLQIPDVQNILFSDDFHFDFGVVPEMPDLISSFFSSSSPIADSCVDETTTTEISASCTSTHMDSDLYLYRLLNGFPFSSNGNDQNVNMDCLMDQDQVSSKCRKEMDLIEMVSAGSRTYQQQ